MLYIHNGIRCSLHEREHVHTYMMDGETAETRSFDHLRKPHLQFLARQLNIRLPSRASVAQLRQAIRDKSGPIGDDVLFTVVSANEDVCSVRRTDTIVVSTNDEQRGAHQNDGELINRANNDGREDDENPPDSNVTETAAVTNRKSERQTAAQLDADFVKWLDDEAIIGDVRKALVIDIGCSSLRMAAMIDDAVLSAVDLKPLHRVFLAAALKRAPRCVPERECTTVRRDAVDAEPSRVRVPEVGQSRPTHANESGLAKERRLYGKVPSFAKETAVTELPHWLERYSRVTKASGWSDSEQIGRLCGYLIHERVEIAYWALYDEMKPGTTFQDFSRDLSKRIVSAGEQGVYQIKFHKLAQASTVQKYYDELVECVRRIRPYAKDLDFESDGSVIGKFLSGLKPELRALCQFPAPATLTDALARALSVESAYQEAATQRSEEKRTADIEIQKLQERIQQLEGGRPRKRDVADAHAANWRVDSRPSKPTMQPGSERPTSLICWRCDKPGHRARDCRAAAPAPHTDVAKSTPTTSTTPLNTAPRTPTGPSANSAALTAPKPRGEANEWSVIHEPTESEVSVIESVHGTIDTAAVFKGVSGVPTKRPVVTGTINGHEVRILLDTGAEMALLHERVYEALKDPDKPTLLRDGNFEARSLSGHHIKLLGHASLRSLSVPSA